MKIVVTDVKSRDKSQVVEFQCDFGAGQGVWLSASPYIGHVYNIEIDCNDNFCLGHNVKLSESSWYSITFDDTTAKLTAKIEDIYDDGIIAIRFGDAVMVVEFDGNVPSKDSWVDMTTNQLELNDVSL